LLSEVLTLVRLTGALIFRVDMHGPWGVAANPTLEKYAPLLPAGTNHIISFHVVLEGTCWMRHGSADWFAVGAGDAVVMPHGDQHHLADEPGRITVPFASMLGGRSVLELRHERFETGNGGTTSLICGFLGCDRHAFEPLFRSLPPTFKFKLGSQLDSIVRYAVVDTLDNRPGSASLRVRFAELLFMEALRWYMESLPANATGWLAGLRDPLVGRAMHALHQAPCRRWSVDDLANATASSRSVLAERFREVIGEPPMHYLTRLRMQLAARRLGESRQSVASVANEVGYESSAAFQRAFKRCFGTPPATWRRHAAVGQ
ncbi:MAG: cupin domain-containing protein, partial [Rhodanobacteraceae bacterium]